MISPSRGTRVPDFTAIISPTFISVTGTSTKLSPRFNIAVWGASSINDSIARRARCTLKASRSSERPNRKVTAAASDHWPIAAAPITATLMSRFMSGASRCAAAAAFGKMNHPPVRMAPTKSAMCSHSGPNSSQCTRSPVAKKRPEIPTEMSLRFCACASTGSFFSTSLAAFRPALAMARISSSGVTVSSCVIVVLPDRIFTRTSLTPGSGLSARLMRETSSAQSMPVT